MRSHTTQVERLHGQISALQQNDRKKAEEIQALTSQTARLQAGLDSQKNLVAMLRRQLDSVTRLLEDDLTSVGTCPSPALRPTPSPRLHMESPMPFEQNAATEQLLQQLCSTEEAYQVVLCARCFVPL